MQKAINKMGSAAGKVSNPKARAALERLVGTYRAKLKTIKGIDSSTTSIPQMSAGLARLGAEGKATLAAWNAWVRTAKAEWNSNPLAGLKVG